MSAPLFQVNDYVAAMQALLPRGFAWPRDPDATLTGVLQGLAPVYYRINQAANGLLVDAFPATTVYLMPEWNATLGLPGATGYTGSDVPTQQAQIVAQLIDSGGQSAAYFEAVAAAYGLPIIVSGYRPYTVDDPVDDEIAGDGWAHVWKVTGNTAGDYGPLRLLFEQYKPAHTTIIWDVPLGPLLLEDGSGFILTEDGGLIAPE